jgi:DNA-binding LacI/PurR family transcriptional regulator
MRKQRLTLQDVANQAGVNRVTAAVALGRSPQGGTRVSDETRNRILTIAEKLGYAPNQIARALRNKRTHIIGYYAGHEALDAHSPFTAAVLQGLQQSCRQYKQDLMLFGSFARDTANSVYATLTSGMIDGLVLLPTPQSTGLERLFDSYLPVVAIANSHPSVVSIAVDDAGGSRRIAEHLAGQGHRHILYRANSRGHVSSARRLEAFLAAAASLQLTVSVVPTSELTSTLSPQEVALLQAPADQRPTAAVCWMDLNAYMLLDACDALGIKVPDELAIIGFDGISLRIRPERKLTTVCAPWAEVAARAVTYVLELLDGKELPHEMILPVELVVGDTG